MRGGRRLQTPVQKILRAGLPITLGSSLFLLVLVLWTLPAHHASANYHSFSRAICNVDGVVGDPHFPTASGW